MNYLQKISAEWPLRLGLGFMYIYSGIDLIRYPSGWTWALPWWFSKIVSSFIPIETYLRIQGAGELIFAAILLAWFLNKKIVAAVALISVFEFLFILFFSPQFTITFRDIGLLGAAASLFLIALKNNGSR
ncbi:MAG: hypothetical protein Q7R73_04805 [bacterium]|nr:hypothetical protein [bacterium]